MYRLVLVLNYTYVISYENIWPGKYSKNISLADFQKPQFKNVIDFCFIILDICSLW